MSIYNILRSVLFKIDAEITHKLTLASLKAWQQFTNLELDIDDIAMNSIFWRCPFKLPYGQTFRNPIGLAAGFDKNGECIPAWQAMGFGFIEVGTITRYPQVGNSKPRIWRLPEEKAIINSIGFNNDGADIIRARLAKLRDTGVIKIPIGINIGKSKITEERTAYADYTYSFLQCYNEADYFVVNVSSPNTPGLRNYQDVEKLKRIILPLCNIRARQDTYVPILIKLSPDLPDDDAIGIAELCIESGIDGLVISNTSVQKEITAPFLSGDAGVSGSPIFQRSTQLLQILTNYCNKKLVFIGVGGVSDGMTAMAKLDAGAALVQSYTGFVYEGPGFARKVLQEILVLQNKRIVNV